VQPEPSKPLGSSTKEEGAAMNLLEWLNSWERAWLFWMGMTGLAFLSIVTGLAIGNWITTLM
tara:strand:+ start:59 stop:244 length:186 start_codon:yes stop_codon:yes gene_type:complete